MDLQDKTVIKNRAFDAMVAAVIGWVWYTVTQIVTLNIISGTVLDILFIICKSLFMPFAFSSLLLAIIGYVINRVRGFFERDMVLVILLAAALGLACYVTAPVIGDIAIVRWTIVFLFFRLIWQFR